MSQKQHKCARPSCKQMCPSKVKYCGDACLAASRSERTAQGVPVESFTVSGIKGELTQIVGERVMTAEDLYRVCKVDASEWEVERLVCNKWEMGAVLRNPGEKDSIAVTELFQIKATLKRKVVVLAAREEIERLKAEAKKALPVVKAVKRGRTKQPACLLQIAIPDVHMGKLAWKPETGANYDLKIAARLFETALEKLVERTAHLPIGRVAFVVGSDLLHTDNPNGTTTRGTPQDTEGRFHKTFWKTREMVQRSIERLRLIAPVDVIMVPGNHDTQTLFHLGDSLECWYHDCEDVKVNNAPTQRKYYEFGKNLLMYTHGDKGKRTDYPLLMATEQPEMFGRTVHREIHTGHIHTLQTYEKHGVRVRVSPALCAADAWHAENAYVGNSRAAEAFVYDAVEGLIAQATWTVPVEEGR